VGEYSLRLKNFLETSKIFTGLAISHSSK